MFLIEGETKKAKKTVAIVTTDRKEWFVPIWIPRSVKNEIAFVKKKASEILAKYPRCNGMTVTCGPVFIGR